MDGLGNLVTYIYETDVDLFPRTYRFATLPGSELGTMATPGDGFPGVYGQALAAFGSGGQGAAVIDQHLSDAYSAEAIVTADTLSEESALLAGNVESGKVLLGEIDDKVEPPLPNNDKIPCSLVHPEACKPPA